MDTPLLKRAHDLGMVMALEDYDAMSDFEKDAFVRPAAKWLGGLMGKGRVGNVMNKQRSLPGASRRMGRADTQLAQPAVQPLGRTAPAQAVTPPKAAPNAQAAAPSQAQRVEMAGPRTPEMDALRAKLRQRRIDRGGTGGSPPPKAQAPAAQSQLKPDQTWYTHPGNPSSRTAGAANDPVLSARGWVPAPKGQMPSGAQRTAPGGPLSMSAHQRAVPGAGAAQAPAAGARGGTAPGTPATSSPGTSSPSAVSTPVRAPSAKNLDNSGPLSLTSQKGQQAAPRVRKQTRVDPPPAKAQAPVQQPIGTANTQLQMPAAVPRQAPVSGSSNTAPQMQAVPRATPPPTGRAGSSQQAPHELPQTPGVWQDLSQGAKGAWGGLDAGTQQAMRYGGAGAVGAAGLGGLQWMFGNGQPPPPRRGLWG